MGITEAQVRNVLTTGLHSAIGDFEESGHYPDPDSEDIGFMMLDSGLGRVDVFGKGWKTSAGAESGMTGADT
jgi:hypothetical protein